MFNVNYNPDVLTCLANLSNDEVFTPPNLANDMLDLLPESLWSNPETTFLDPFTKSGVFLREIADRLMKGLENVIPDKQERINHIFNHQVFGIAITELTSLLARRSVYCSKTANGQYSVCETFTTKQGNIIFDHIDHTWENGKCKYCGANQGVYDRDDTLETHAYQFIHTDNAEEIFDMRFDVIVGNPPYQLSDGGFGISATPIYHKFVLQGKRLNPRYLTMIIPARWFSGGKGMDDFRKEMLHDNRLREIHDFPEASDCFPGVQIKGGVCYFLWSRDNRGLCKVSTYKGGELVSLMERPLLEEGSDVFIRFNEAVSILKKVQAFEESSLKGWVSSRKPFGLPTTFKGEKEPFEDAIKLFQNGGIGYISYDKIAKNIDMVNHYKVLVPRAGSGSDSFPHTILGKPFVTGPRSACTETYIVVGTYDTFDEANHVCTYISSKFFRFLVLLMKSTQDAPARVYKFVPMQDFSQKWTDEKLYKKYGITDDEVVFIDSLIRPMELNNE